MKGRRLSSVLAFCAFLVARHTLAEPALTIEEAFRALGVARSALPAGDLTIRPDDVRSLDAIFRVTDEVAPLNVSVSAWLRSNGSRGLHAGTYRERSAEVRRRLDALRLPDHLVPVRELLAEALQLQDGFVSEWADAIAAGRRFESQLTSENGYHEGLHRAHRKLVQAFGELRALYPGAAEESQQVFRDHLRAMDFL